MRALGFEQESLLRTQSFAFAARSAQVEYHKSARLDDMVIIVSEIVELGRAQIVFSQRAERNGELLVDARMRIAGFNPERGRAVAMPKAIHEILKTLVKTSE